MSKFLKNTRIKRNALESLVTLHFYNLPRAFLRWNLPNDYRKPMTFFEKKEMNGKQLNIIPVSVCEDKVLREIQRILKQLLAEIDKIKVDRNHKTKLSRQMNDV